MSAVAVVVELLSASGVEEEEEDEEGGESVSLVVFLLTFAMQSCKQSSTPDYS